MPDETQLVQQVKDTFGASDEAARNLVEVTRSRREQRNVDNVFTPESLAPNELITVPRPQTVRGIQDDLAGLTVSKDNFAAEQARLATLAEQRADSSFQDQVDAMFNAPTRSELEKSAEEELGIDTAGLSKQIADIDTQLLAEQEALLSKVERIEKNQVGKSASAIQADIADAETDSLRKRLRLRIEKDFLNNDLISAESRINRLVDIETEQIQRKIDVLDAVYTRYQDKFTLAEQRAYDAKLSEWEDAKQDKRDIAGIAQTVAGNGGNASLVGQILESGSVERALQLGANYISNPIDRAIKNLNYQKAQLEYNEYKTRTEISNSSEWGDLIDDTQTMVGVEKGKLVADNLADAIKDGNNARAFKIVANSVEEKLTGEVKTKFANARKDYAYLDRLQKDLENFVAESGDTNILTGTVAEIQNKLLGYTSNPELSALATQLDRSFQAYRTEMTGAAFSPEESRDYAKVNPTTTKTFELNSAIITGARNDLSNKILSTVDERVDGAEKLWNLANGVTEAEYIDGVSNAIESNTEDDIDNLINDISNDLITPLVR